MLAARDDVNEFASYAFRDAVTGLPVEQADIHRELQAAIFDPAHTHNIIEFPRNHGKTTQVEIAVLWELGNDPNLRFKFVCEADSKAIERLQLITQHIEKNDRVRDVFPWLRPSGKGDWTKKKIVVERSRIMRDASIEACGIQTAATGGRADRVIADDPVGRRNALELPKLRETVKRAWHSDWLNLLEPNGRVNYICTPWHTADLTHELKRNSTYRVTSRPVGPGFEPVWPERWSSERLKEKRRELGQREYDRGYRLVALSGEFSTVSEDIVSYWKFPPHLGNLVVFQGYDLATGEGEDYFACATVGLDPDSLGALEPRLYILDGWHQQLSFLGQAESVKEQAGTWKPETMVIEATQYQAVLPQVLKNTTLIAGIKPVKPRVSKSLRLSSVTPLLERGQILFNPALDPERGSRGALVDELVSFPLGAHDDLVDAFVYAVTAAVDFSLRAASTSGVSVTSIGPETALPSPPSRSNGNGQVDASNWANVEE